MALIKARWNAPRRSDEDCGKVRFADASGAEHAMELVVGRQRRRRAREVVASVYFCRGCQAYHWGNRPAKFTSREYAAAVTP